MNKLIVGAKGEYAACVYLKKNGYKILKRNYKKSFGEIDIIAKKNEDISFVEVKTRKNEDFGRPCQAVNESKKSKIRKTAMAYIVENALDENYSFDVIEVFHSGGEIIKLEHIKNAFF